MVSRFQDGWLLLGLTILGYGCAHVIHKQLSSIRRITEVPKEEAPAQDKINQRTQNAIKIDTLGELLGSTSPEIRWACAKILSERNIQDGNVWKIIRRDLAGKNFTRRDRALTSLNFLTSYFRQSLQADPHFGDLQTYTAMVQCLCNMLPAASEAEAEALHHTPAEADALWIMQQLLEISESNIPSALMAGLVSKWLCRYPFQTKWPKKEKKEIVNDMIYGFEYDDDYENFLCSILRILARHSKGRSELKQYGLADASHLKRMKMVSEDTFLPMEQINHVLVEADEEAALIPVNEGGQGLSGFANPTSNARRREESLEERSLRRRRREAMVYAENGRPIQREDIIEQDSFVDEEFREELEQLIEEVEATDLRTIPRETWLGWLSRSRPDGIFI